MDRPVSFGGRPAVLLLGIAFVAIAGTAVAASVPGLPTARQLAPTQRFADEAFEDGRYDDAMRVFLQSLAPAGDKYSQHMIGWMHLHGLGVQADPVTAAAWIMLSSERGDRKLVALRDEILDQLRPDSLRAARSRADELLAEYGDCALVRAAVESRTEFLGDTTGSRLGHSEALLTSSIAVSPEAQKGPDLRNVRRDTKKMERFLRKHCRD